LSPRNLKVKREAQAKHSHPTWVKHHRNRNIIVILIVAAVLSTAVMVAVSLSSTGVKVGQKAPDFNVLDINNNYFHLYGHQGTPMLLEFMYTTCPHCVNEAPILASLYSSHQTQMAFVSISVSWSQPPDTPSTLTAFSTKYNEPWTFVQDTSGLTGSYGVTSTPTMFLLDKNSVVRYNFVGETSQQTLENAVQAIL
jgi:peroxiredoxin